MCDEFCWVLTNQSFTHRGGCRLGTLVFPTALHKDFPSTKHECGSRQYSSLCPYGFEFRDTHTNLLLVLGDSLLM